MSPNYLMVKHLAGFSMTCEFTHTDIYRYIHIVRYTHLAVAFLSCSYDFLSHITFYLFLDRASIEPNFHDLYLKFLDKVTAKALNKEIVQATYENCKVCLITNLFMHLDVATSVNDWDLFILF